MRVVSVWILDEQVYNLIFNNKIIMLSMPSQSVSRRCLVQSWLRLVEIHLR